MRPRILCVDDEPNVLEAYQRNLHKQFDVETATGGEKGLEVLALHGPYAVVVSDFRMPGMNGAQFLAKVSEQSPDSVRVMLTGQADLSDTMSAVNEGKIFRFLTKPCPPEVLVKTLYASVEQHRLIRAERDLLEKTLSGAINMLTEVLSLINPAAFSRAYRLRRYVRHMAQQLNFPDVWQFEVAALLSPIGSISLPPEILDRLYAGTPLSSDEEELVAAQPKVAYDLIANIPRLEAVAQMIAGQLKPGDSSLPIADSNREDVVARGVKLLQVASSFDEQITRGVPQRSALARMQVRTDEYDASFVSALSGLEPAESNKEVRFARVRDLHCLMVANEDIKSKNGLLLLAKGQEVTASVIARLRSFSHSVGVREPFSVWVPRHTKL